MVSEKGLHMPEAKGAVTGDWQRFLRAREGDHESWRELVETYRSRLTALALLITGSHAAADDVVQETFVRAAEAVVRDTRGTVHGFFGTIAYRLAVKESKRRTRLVNLEATESVDDRPNALETVLRDERDLLVAETIRELSRDHRDVLLLRFYGGHSYEEIAELTELPLGTVKSRIFYAVKSCRYVLRKKGVLE